MQEPVIEGRSVTMDCVYDLAGGTLYSINWRFEGKEFLRLLRPFPVHPQSESSSTSTTSTTTTSSPFRKSSRDRMHGKNGEYGGRSRSRTHPQQQRPGQRQTSTGQQQQPLPQQPHNQQQASSQWTMNHVFTPVPGVDVDVSTVLQSLFSLLFFAAARLHVNCLLSLRGNG